MNMPHNNITKTLIEKFPADVIESHEAYGDTTVIVKKGRITDILRFLKEEIQPSFEMLIDLCGVDYLQWKDSARFEVVYHLLSLKTHDRVRVRAPLSEEDPTIDSVSPLWKAADWYEREVFDMFGIIFHRHPNLKRILMFEGFEGHPLRKDYPAEKRQQIPTAEIDLLHLSLQNRHFSETDHLPTRSMILNIGPSHPAMHGALRYQVELDGETIHRAVAEIGYLHRAFEKHSESSTYTQVIPYTDRLNYLSSMMNNVGFAHAVEKIMGVEIPPRAKMIRVIVCELSRIMDHLVCLAAAFVDLGALTNFWYFFDAREKKKYQKLV